MNIPASGELRLRAILPGGEVGDLVRFRFSHDEIAVYDSEDECLGVGTYEAGAHHWLVGGHMTIRFTHCVSGKEAAVRALQRIAGAVMSNR